MLSPTIVVAAFCFSISFVSAIAATTTNLTLPHQHPNPEAVVQHLQRKVKESIDRRKLLELQEKDQSYQCSTGNPIDDCWRCNPSWQYNPQILAGCSIGFGHDSLGGNGGKLYYVTNPSDSDPVNPAPGTLRYGVIQTEPLWILFSGSMVINLKYELIINSFKTIDGRGPRVEITGKGCLIIQSVTNVIIHNIHIHHCKPSGNAKIRRSPTEVVGRGPSDGDGITVMSSSKIWIDHCTLSYCTDGLIDVTHGSTAVTISNNYFSHHDKVMLLGHSDDFTADTGMQVTVAFNHFGESLKERMPRCRFGYFHVANNDYQPWGMYAVGGSSGPTINSQGNRYVAPINDNKEVTKRMDTKESEWRRWNWRTEGDLMVNGAFFVASGTEFSTQFAEASSMQPLSAALIEQLTSNAGVAALPSMGNTNTGGTVPAGPNPDVTVPNPGSNGGGTVVDPTTPGVVGSNPGLVPPGSNGGGTNMGYGYNYNYGYSGGTGPLYNNGATSVSRCGSIMFTLVASVLSFCAACMYQTN